MSSIPEEETKAETVSFMQAISFCKEFVAPYKGKFIWSLIFHLLDLLPHVTLPLITMYIVDRVIPSKDTSALLMCLCVVLVMLALNVFFWAAYRAGLVQVLKDVTRDMRNMIVRRLQLLSLSYHNRSHTGRYFSKIITDVERIENFANMGSTNVIGITAFTTIAVTSLALINAKILLIFVLFLPVMATLRMMFKKRMRTSRKRERKARESLSATVSNFLQSSLLARMHGHEHYEHKKIDDSSVNVTRMSVDAECDVALFQALGTASTIFFHFIVVSVCAIYVMNGELSFGELLLFTAYISQIANQITQVVNMMPQAAVFTESVTSLKEITDAPDIEFNQGKRKVEKLTGRITFEDVSFSYDNDFRRILRDISVDIAPGMTVGLVGKSGSGKSTFVNMALGLYRTKNGVVSIDGMPVDNLDMRSARKHMAVVSQTPIMFTGSIYENIVHAYRDVPMEKVIDAARKANAHEFIVKLSKGYDSQVGEQGTMLSGGEKQRIALARSILREPAILVLDEATSALDSESELLVQQALNNLDNSITKLIIAHRLSTVKNADIILVFKDGEIVERGSHLELTEKNGEYARLVRHQTMETTDDEGYAETCNAYKTISSRLKARVKKESE